jgi:exonuclease VII large subunit
LVWQNDQHIAEAICRLPIPVILATGHTSDRSLLDEIVWHAAKTPSDAAHLIVDGVEQMAGRLEKIQESIVQNIQNRLEMYAQHIDQRYTWTQLDAKRIRIKVAQNILNRWTTIQLLGPEQQTRR